MVPTQSGGMPPLTQNIEGLRSHALLVSIFVGPPEATPAQRRWRSWLVHCLTKAARHYENARKLTVMDAREANDARPDGQALPMLDYAFELEDCITSLDKAFSCIQALHGRGEFPDSRVMALASDVRLLRAFRNKQEHLHNHLASGETANGPILVAVDSNGLGIQLQKLSMTFSTLYGLIDAVYRDIASLFPRHDANSSPRAAGIPRLQITATVTTIPHEPGKI